MSVIECKRSDSEAIKNRNDCWNQILRNFNAKFDIEYDVTSLIKKWSNIKKDLKTREQVQKWETFRTGI